MLGLVAAALFAGYTLVYAAVADGGRFASTPWESLRRDAYAAGSSSSSASGQASHPSTWDTITGVARKASNLPWSLLP